MVVDFVGNGAKVKLFSSESICSFLPIRKVLYQMDFNEPHTRYSCIIRTNQRSCWFRCHCMGSSVLLWGRVEYETSQLKCSAFSWDFFMFRNIYCYGNHICASVHTFFLQFHTSGMPKVHSVWTAVYLTNFLTQTYIQAKHWSVLGIKQWTTMHNASKLNCSCALVWKYTSDLNFANAMPCLGIQHGLI